jgi:hypothetical protein
MTTASHQIVQLLAHLVKLVPIGTNRALLQLMWTMVSGAFLHSRGAVHSALQDAGFGPDETRRSWQALRYGVWSNEELLRRWRDWVASETDWQPHQYEGWQPLAIDLTAFWRPRLQGWAGRYFHQLAQRLLPAVAFAVVVQVGHSAGQRVPLLRKVLRGSANADTTAELAERLLTWVSRHLAPAEVAVCDAGFKLQQLQVAGVPRFVLRLARNCTVRRNVLPPGYHRGRPREYGTLLRPLARRYRQRTLPASAPDVSGAFTLWDETAATEITVEFQGWHNVVRADQRVATTNETVTVWVFFDPRFRDPLVLATNLVATAATSYHLYRDRWPVEQVPLVAKQMLGLQRQFVFAPTSVWRLPELSLLLGNVLTIMATLLPALPSGYWDRHPKKRPAGSGGRWRRRLFQTLTHWTSEFGKKRRSATTCPRALPPIAGCREAITPIERRFQVDFGPHC